MGHVRQIQSQALSLKDRDFLNFVVQDNYAEIQYCILAEKRALDYAVKAFTRLIAEDHVGIASRLAALLDAEQFEAPNGIGHEGQTAIMRLDALPPAEFDGRFMLHQIKDHERDLQRFEEILSETRNASIRKFAKQTYTILAQQFALAKAVDGSLKRRAGARFSTR